VIRPGDLSLRTTFKDVESTDLVESTGP
jgi:hypothetical protein